VEALQESAWRRAATWRVAAARRLEKVIHNRLIFKISDFRDLSRTGTTAGDDGGGLEEAF
jgi:hypothetical protein